MRFPALLGLVLVVGCKPDPTEVPAKPANTATRSGHIEVPTLPAPRHSASDDRDRRAQRREERRQAREERMDADGNGSVSEEERATDRRERATTMHQRLDRDHDGKLSPAELGDTPFGRRYNVATIDRDNDGDVSPDELVTAMETYLPPPRRKRKP